MNTTRTASHAAPRGVPDGMASVLGARQTAQQRRGAESLSTAEPAPQLAGARLQGQPAQADSSTTRGFTCRCGRPVFFRNSACQACRTPLGYDADSGKLLPLEPADDDRKAPLVAPPVDVAVPSVPPPWWRAAGAGAGAARFSRCSNLDTAAACNWLVAEGDQHAGNPPGNPRLCRCCRLTHILPDLTLPNAEVWWNRIELAKRRLVSSLIGLQLPVLSKAEDPARGLSFELLRAQPGQPPVATGHADGLITIDVEEADDAWRAQRRMVLGAPHRTLLGCLRHESGHYYWQRLVDQGPWLKPFREAFGDERQDYAQALQKHQRNGAPADWEARFVSSYASSHPWEDWSETWAHYLSLVDTVDTARSFGMDGEHVELSSERLSDGVVGQTGTLMAAEFQRLVNSWMELTGVLNELSRSMGIPDFYPFVLSHQAVRKLFMVHQVVRSAQRAV